MLSVPKEKRTDFIKRHIRNAIRFGETDRVYDLGQCDLCKSNNARCFSTIFRYSNKKSGRDYSFNICDGCNTFRYQAISDEFAILQFAIAATIDTEVLRAHCNVCKRDYRTKTRFYFGNNVAICYKCISKTNYQSRPKAYYRRTYYQETLNIQSCVHCGTSPVFLKIEGKPHCQECLPKNALIITTELSNYAGD